MHQAASGDPRIGRLGRARATTLVLGPAFVAAVAYVDPGNFATNFSAGAQFGYSLIWVVVLANIVAMLVQQQSAKLGVASGRDLAENCREHFPRPVSRGLWVQAELVTMATDVAEIVGAAVGLHLLFGVPLFAGGVVAALVSFAMLELTRRGHRPFERAVVALLAVVGGGLCYNLLTVPVEPVAVVGGLAPSLGGGSEAALLAAGIVGATVMPHVVYLHSALTRDRAVGLDLPARRTMLRHHRLDVVLALSLAGSINLVMVITAAALFAGRGPSEVDSLISAHADLARLAGGGAALAFAVALLASGLSSSSVGTYAGQVVMQGFVRLRISMFLRRGITMLPALVVLGAGLPVTDSLVISQVVLSFGIPFALVPLTLATSRRAVMGELVDGPLTTATLWVVTVAISSLNIYLVWTVVAP